MPDDYRLVSVRLHDDVWGRQTASALPQLVVRTLGTEQILLNGHLVSLGWRHPREVVYHLLAHPEGVPPAVLAEAIWPCQPSSHARNRLKSAICQIRAALPQGLIELQERKLYRIDRAAAQIDYDVAHFLALLDAARANPALLDAALDRYGGIYLPWTDNLWAGCLRAELEQRYLLALHAAAVHAFHEERVDDALVWYRRVLAVDPLDEAAHAGVMRCQLARGNRAAAYTQYRTIRDLLGAELGIAVGLEVEALYQQIANR